MTIRYHQLLWRFLLYRFEQVTSYRLDFVVGLVGTILVRIGSFLPVWIVLSQISTLTEWTIPRVALLYGIAGTVRGIHHLLFTGMVDFEDHVRQGTLDVLLIRPVNTLVQVYGSDIQVDAVGDLLMGWGFVAYALWWQPSIISLAGLGALIFYIVCASLIFAAFTLTVGATAVWSFSSLAPAQIVFQVFNFVYYPLDVYQGLTRRVLTGFLPFAVLSYYPTLALLGMETVPYLPLWAGCSAIVLFGGAYSFWSYALTQYSSSGS